MCEIYTVFIKAIDHPTLYSFIRWHVDKNIAPFHCLKRYRSGSAKFVVDNDKCNKKHLHGVSKKVLNSSTCRFWWASKPIILHTLCPATHLTNMRTITETKVRVTRCLQLIVIFFVILTWLAYICHSNNDVIYQIHEHQDCSSQ